MKDQFFEYYHPTKDEYDALWARSLIVLDTNALLDLYRFPSSARTEFIQILEKLTDRLWMAHQVGLEFHRNRLTVMSSKGKSIDQALLKTSNLYDDVRKHIISLEIDRYNLDVKTEPLLQKLKQASDEIASAIMKVDAAQKSVVDTDTIREKIVELYQNKIGKGPENDGDLAQLILDGDRRYSEKIPPGYMDADKGKNSSESTYYHNNIKYEKRYGDLIFWRQLINHVKENDIKSVILVTGEKKEDWWQEKEGKIIGPQPELTREIHRETSIEKFWMYSPDQFLRFANEFLHAEVTPRSIEQVREVGLQVDPQIINDEDAESLIDNELLVYNSHPSQRNNRFIHRKVVSDMTRWLEGYVEGLVESIYPDFVGNVDGKEYGFELVYTQGITAAKDQEALRSKIKNMKTHADVNSIDLYVLIGVTAADFRREFGVYQKGGRRVLIESRLKILDPTRALAGIYFGYSDGSSFRVVYYRAGAGPDFVASQELDIFRSGTIKD